MYVQFAQRFLCVVLALPLCLLSAATWSQEAGRGLTADLEVGYLQFIIDHHFAALRLTELAAGTEEIRQSEITDAEGVSPTPETDALEGRAEREELRSLARKVNNRDREEILTAQRYLEEWYGIQHNPRLTEGDEVLIRELDQAQGGSDFDGLFLEVLSVHHYRATVATLNCIVGRDIAHDQLYRFCKSILEQALLEIDDMRELLLSEFGIEDFQPFAVPEIDDFADRNNLPVFPSAQRAHRARIPVARGVIGTRSLGGASFAPRAVTGMGAASIGTSAGSPTGVDVAFSMRTDVIGPDMDVSRNGFLFDRLTGLDMARSIMADVILADSGLAARNSVLLDNPSGVNAARSITRSVIAANGAFFGSSTAGELEPSITRDAIVPGPIAANRNNIASGRVTVGRARAAGSNTQPVVVRSNAGFD